MSDSPTAAPKKPKPSNAIITYLNAFTMVLALPIIAVGIWLTTQTGSECAKFLQAPVLFIGVFILFISFIGYFGSHLRITFLLWVYLFTMAMLIILLAAFTIFTFLVTLPGKGHTVQGQAFKEYRLKDYSPWLSERFNQTSTWNSIKSCTLKEGYCKRLDHEYKTREEYFNGKLSPLESGCCKPPAECGFTSENATVWSAPRAMGANNSDCYIYTNDKFCEDCSSCKGGFVSFIQKEWRIAFVVQLTVLIALLVIYCTGCCARYNAGKDDYFIRLAKEYEMERV
eukprot:TRINITY_DN16387_c0_g1_i1.p1 TRINITY_DN16387_c0_g1~~TRINITY_DN16387_c0_g1_i1.p1  ORF type:complete len:284 (-),score=40.08 TRINITY_DN16387_c0_g1_i1:763-1614(-)